MNRRTEETVERDSTTSAAPATARGAHSVGGRRHGLGWLPWALLGLLALLALGIWGLIAALGDDDDDEATGAVQSEAEATAAPAADPAPPAAGAPAPTTTVAGAAGAGAAGGASLTANGQDVLGLAGDPAVLAGLAGGAVTGRAPVESVVSDEGFWVGNSPEQRVFVFITEAARGTQGESPFQVQPGQIVEITGTMQPATTLPQDLEDADGRAQLETQGFLVAADALTLVQ
jgi:hypothetical protein